MSADDHHPPAAPPPDSVTDPKWLGPVIGLVFASIVLLSLGAASVASYNSEGSDAGHSEDADHSEEGDHDDSDAGHEEDGHEEDGHDGDEDHADE